jgi:hypothetical protein
MQKLSLKISGSSRARAVVAPRAAWSYSLRTWRFS